MLTYITIISVEALIKTKFFTFNDFYRFLSIKDLIFWQHTMLKKFKENFDQIKKSKKVFLSNQQQF